MHEMQAQQVEERTYGARFLEFIKVDNFNLKFVADHMRNYGIVAAFYTSGFFSGQHGYELWPRLPAVGYLIAFVFYAAGYMLALFNILQILFYFVRPNPRSVRSMFTATAVGFVLTFAMLDVVVVLITQAAHNAARL